MTTQAGLDAAYATEINSCSFNADSGTRIRSRPQQFCDSVTIDSTLAVAGASAFGGTATFALPIVVRGFVFTPTPFLGQTVLATGSLVLPAPTPPSPIPPDPVFSSITVTEGAVFNNVSISGTAEGVFDAGAY